MTGMRVNLEAKHCFAIKTRDIKIRTTRDIKINNGAKSATGMRANPEAKHRSAIRTTLARGYKDTTSTRNKYRGCP
ncbi:hypothetical protein RHMOL_Rhmol13G0300000 [Rhododendron molle]|uniref:Uncharacterized protein n=1 Tax=Rhododendron molle TaxID=49168 RepID=A0ACC0LCP0_RHOML|nr:hypothetical protein RHMOL_Rhmol13G0300000 [Rhododendron molle]